MSFHDLVPWILLAGDGVWWWQARRLLRGRSLFWRGAVAAFMAVQLGGAIILLLTHLPALASESWVPRPVLAVIYLWHFLILPPLCGGALAAELRRHFLRRASSARQPCLDASGLTRREFLAVTVATAPAVAACGLAGFSMWQLTHFRLRRLEVALPQLPPELDGLTLAQVTDLHVGRFTHGAILEQVVRVTNALQADLVLLTGDLINYSLRDLPVALELVRALRGRHGVFLCEGNRDLLQDRLAFRQRIWDAALPLLSNSAATVQIRGRPVQLLGLRWGSGEGDSQSMAQRSDAAIVHSMRELLPLVQSEAFPILLAHHPHAFDYAGSLPLTLSGHTHGGQLMLTQNFGIGSVLFRYWSGLYQRGGRALVVSNGVGNWFPLRVNAPAEIVHLTLRRG